MELKVLVWFILFYHYVNVSQSITSNYSILGHADDYPSDFYPSILNNCNESSPFGIPLHLSKHIIKHKHRFNRWIRLLNSLCDPNHDRWSVNKVVTIVFLGGSMTAGHGLHSPPTRPLSPFCSYATDTICPIDTIYSPCLPCAFSNRFRHWIEQTYPTITFHIYSLAKGGVNSEGILGTIDYLFNDIPTPIDIIFLNYVDNDRNFRERANDHISAAYEQLIRYSLLYNKNLIIVNIEMYTQSTDLTYTPHELVLQYYHIPSISYDKMVP